MRDVIIVGAGPAGSTLACFLAAQGLDVLLVDKADFPRDKTCGDALSPRALHVLDQLGLLDPIRAAGCLVRRAVFFSPNGRHIESPVPPYGDLPGYSVVLPRYQLDDLIRQRAIAAGAEFQAHVTVTDVLREAARDGERFVGIRATTPEGPVDFRARVTVLAVGAAVSVLQRANLLTSPPAFGRAARTYYEGVAGLSDAVEFHYDSVPLPGYGWVFPTSPTSANVGAGDFGQRGQPKPRNSPRQAFDEFIANPYVAGLLANARQTAPIKGYPLRFDFPTARTAFPGLLLVGEGCGLVNPLSGEGIDYAVESAEVAAEILVQAMTTGKSAAQTAQTYSRALQDRFMRTFVNVARIRDVYLRPWVLNRFVAAASHNDDLKLLLIHIALGNVDPAKGLAANTLLQVALG